MPTDDGSLQVYLSAMKRVFGKAMEHTLMTKGEQGTY